MALATALPALMDTLAAYLPAYVSDLGTVYGKSSGPAIPDAVNHEGGDKTAIIYVLSGGTFDREDGESQWPTQGSGGVYNDEDLVRVVCLHGTVANVKPGTIQTRGLPYKDAVRQVLRAHKRLGLPRPGDDLFGARAKSYVFGRFEWGGELWIATDITVLLAYEAQLTAAD